MIELDSSYTPKNYESKWYKFWRDNNVFHAEADPTKKPYVILMPPPNVTSQLHMGHGTGYTIQDLFIRWKRMSGFNACWLPGTDHAGIATQMMVEKSLFTEEGKTKKDIGRAAFLEKLWAWREKYGGMIIEQFETIGYSCDWERLAFTMDPKLSDAVRHVFVELYNEGLIYRSERLVNWDPVLLTAVSDDEVENKEIHGHLWYLSYPIEGCDEKIPFATTRPETMLGDTAVAVNPEDERFKHLIGKKVKLPFTGRLIPIVGDDYVKSEFGTGCVKITPAHDPNDFDIGKRHNLPFINVMNEDGTMNDLCPDEFKGLDRFAARKLVLKRMKELELFDKEEAYKHSVPHSERSKSIIEPRLSLQWYVRMKELAEPAAELARKDELKFYPDSWKKTYLYWLDNIQDWCISRQLWWGHRIPIWYCNECDGITTGTEDPSSCSKCNSTNIKQDEDVLDTWFSSWLWPMSPFGWPEKSDQDKKDMEYFYPSDVLVTAPEIIFLWVARMVMAGLKFKGKSPFKEVYFNATVCDKKGQKFSKTLGNGIDPMHVIDKFGADAVRYTAVSLAPLGGRLRMSEEDFDAGAKFVNKLWNASRFLLRNLDENEAMVPLSNLELSTSSKWLLERFRQTVANVETKFAAYRLNDGVQDIYHFIWDNFCDWAIETAKDSFQSSDERVSKEAKNVLTYVLDGCLRLVHPIMPFVTEEIWQKLPKHPDWNHKSCLCISDYPVTERLTTYREDFDKWSKVQSLVSGTRSIRSQAGIPPKVRLAAHVVCDKKEYADFAAASDTVRRLAGIDKLSHSEVKQELGPCLVHVDRNFSVYVPAEGLIDSEKEIKRMSSEITRIEKIILGIDKKLSNKSFVDNAPEDIILQNKEQHENLTQQVQSLKENLNSLKA